MGRRTPGPLSRAHPGRSYAPPIDTTDIVLIEQLAYKYGHLVDARAWPRFDELFVPDAVVDYTLVNAPEVLTGLDAIVGYFESANHPAAHHVSNVWVEEHDGDVRVWSKFWAPYTRESHRPKRWFGGDYEDVVVHTAAGWRFARRSCRGRWQYTLDVEPGSDDHIEARRRTY